MKYDSWNEHDDNFLKNNYHSSSAKECAKHLNRTIVSVKARALRLGLSKQIKDERTKGNKFKCSIMVDDDILTIVVRAKNERCAKEYIENKYKQKVIGTSDFKVTQYTRDYYSGGMNGRWGGVTTTKHFRKS